MTPAATSARRLRAAVALGGAALALLAGCATATRPPAPAAEFWLDLARAEEVTPADVLADLAGAGVVYVGEAHTVRGHHEVQLQLLQGLFARGVPLVLCLEQLEARDQPAVDRYNRRAIDFAQLAEEIGWARKWRNYDDYRDLCEFARQHRIPVHGLNAPAEVIRAVSRGGGVASLPPDVRSQLPADLVLDDPAYERLLRLELAVHATLEEGKVRPMFEAQVARDEAMAAAIVAARRPPEGPARTAFVVLGAGHMRYGFGTAERVRRREGPIVERLVLITINAPVHLRPEEKAASRDVTIPHAALRDLGRVPADYLRVLPRLRGPLPPGHPPLPE